MATRTNGTSLALAVPEAPAPIYARQAEQAVLGSVLIDPSCIYRVMEQIGQSGDAFHDAANATIWRVMVDMNKRHQFIDIVTLDEEIERRGLSETCGGFLRLSELSSAVPSAMHVTTYAEQLVDAYNARRKAWAAGEIVKLAYQKLPAQELDAKVADLMRQADLGLAKTWRGRIEGAALVDDLQRDRERAEASQGRRDGLVTGIEGMDAMLKPLEGGDLMFLLAPTSTGKTITALMALRANALAGHRPTFYFNELSMKRLRHRLAVMESIDWGAYQAGRTLVPMPALSTDEINTATYREEDFLRAADSLAKWTPNVVFVPAHGWSASDIQGDFTSLWVQGQCDMVLVDYLDLVGYNAARNVNSSDVIGEKLMVLKNGAASCKLPYSDGIPIFVTGQPPKGFASSDSEKPPRRPALDDAFGSVRPAQFASKFLTLWRQQTDDGPTGYTLMRIEKNPDDGNEGYEEKLRVAGSKERRGFVFFPAKQEVVRRAAWMGME